MQNWGKLNKHFHRLGKNSIQELFLKNKVRANQFTICVEDLVFDYSKTLIDKLVMTSLIELLTSSEVLLKRDSMFAGNKINTSEGKSVLHTALRKPKVEQLWLDGINVMEDVHDTLKRLAIFSESVRNGAIQGAGGRITDIVNIGIGGSDLGPEMAYKALFPYADGPTAHFISNIDGAQITECLSKLNPKNTLIVVASKTFTTTETLINAKTARQWMIEKVNPQSIEKQFAAVSSNIDKCIEFGINPSNVFGFRDWVGGRYSIWGPVGLPIMISIGQERFQQFLKGGYSMDKHFRTAPPSRNLPMIHALIGIWHHQVCGYATQAILPYDHRLRRFPAYLQQLIMESNGKSITLNGEELKLSSAAVIWGEPGTNGQHAFFQALHQGNQVVPCEFLIAANGHETELTHHHNMLVANCLAQSESLLTGRVPSSEDATAIHRRCLGNRPSTTLLYPKLTPFVLGQLIALYEHSVFTEGLVLDINSFDQWGVELGKEIANSLLLAVTESKLPPNYSSSTVNLLNYIYSTR